MALDRRRRPALAVRWARGRRYHPHRPDAI